MPPGGTRGGGHSMPRPAGSDALRDVRRRELPQFAGERMPRETPGSRCLAHEEPVAEDAVGGVQDRERGAAREIRIGEVRAHEPLGPLVAVHRE